MKWSITPTTPDYVYHVPVFGALVVLVNCRGSHPVWNGDEVSRAQCPLHASYYWARWDRHPRHHGMPFGRGLLQNVAGLPLCSLLSEILGALFSLFEPVTLLSA